MHRIILAALVGFIILSALVGFGVPAAAAPADDSDIERTTLLRIISEEEIVFLLSGHPVFAAFPSPPRCCWAFVPDPQKRA